MGTSQPRIMRGLTILAQPSQVKKIDARTYRVKSQSKRRSYVVVKDGVASVQTTSSEA